MVRSRAPRRAGACCRFGLEPNRYILYVSRLEPENNAHLVIEAYERVETDLPLVIVGGAPYARSTLRSSRAHGTPASGFLALSSAKTTARCNRTRTAMCTRLKSVELTRH